MGTLTFSNVTDGKNELNTRAVCMYLLTGAIKYGY